MMATINKGYLFEVLTYFLLGGLGGVLTACSSSSGNQKAVSIPSYSVTFNSFNGTAVSSQSIEHGDTVVRPEDPSAEDFIFLSWFEDESLTTPYNFSTPVRTDISLYASWASQGTELANMSFISNGGNHVTDVAVPSDNVPPQPSLPVRQGYVFDGWYRNDLLTMPYDFSEPLSQDIILYAKWELDRNILYTVVFNSGDANAISKKIAYTNSTIARPSNPVRQGFAFVNWFTDPEYTNVYNFSSPINQSFTLYGKWVASDTKFYTIHFNAMGGTNVSSIIIDSNSIISAPTSTRDKYIFSGWFLEDNTETIYDFSSPITQDLSLFAKWEAGTDGSFIITFNSNNGADARVQTVGFNESIVNYPAPVQEGYIFDGWYLDDNTFQNPYDLSTSVTQNITLYAKWRTASYVIQFNTNGSSISLSDIVADYNTQISEPATPTRDRLVLDGWYIDDNTFQIPYEFASPITQNLVLYAKWISKYYNVRFKTYTNAIIEPQIVEYNSTVSKPPTPSESESEIIGFGGWYTHEFLTNIYDFSLPVTTDIILFAKWKYRFTYDIASRGVTGINPNITNNISLTIPKNIINGTPLTSISPNAFENNSNIQSITMPNTIVSIGRRAFYNSRIGGILTIPDSVLIIADSAFVNCNRFTDTLNIPESVLEILDGAFIGMNGITSFRFRSSTPPAFGRNIFELATGQTILVPQASLDQYRNAPNFNQYNGRILGY